MKIFFPFLLSLFLFTGVISAQQDPVGLCANVTVDGLDVQVNVEVENFENISAYQFGIGWQDSKYSFVSVDNINDEVPSVSNQVTEDVPDAVSLLRVVWFDETAINPRTLEDGTVLMTINLQLSDPNEMGPIGIAGSEDFIIEFVNGSTELVDVNVNSLGCSTLAFNSIVNIDDLIIQEFEVSPNPFSEKLTISTDENLNGSFSVYSATGKLIKQNIIARGTETNLALPNLAPGTYILKYVSEDNFTQGQIKIFKI